MTAALPEAIRAAGTPIEVWFQDEARVGQQGSLTYVWAEKGSRPRALKDPRYEWAYLLGTVCAGRGAGAALMLPYANANAMTLHLAEVRCSVAPGAHAVLVCNSAGWHKTDGRLPMPAVPGAGLVVVQPGFRLGGLEAVLDGPAAALDLDQLVRTGAGRAPRREERKLAVGQAAPDQPPRVQVPLSASLNSAASKSANSR